MIRTSRIAVRTDDRENEMFRTLSKKYGMDVSELVRSMAFILVSTKEKPAHFRFRAAVAAAEFEGGLAGTRNIPKQ